MPKGMEREWGHNDDYVVRINKECSNKIQHNQIKLFKRVFNKIFEKVKRFFFLFVLFGKGFKKWSKELELGFDINSYKGAKYRNFVIVLFFLFIIFIKGLIFFDKFVIFQR